MVNQIRLMEEHARWGCSLHATDIDHLVIEYSHCQPKALIEYKHENVGDIEWGNAQFKVLERLGNSAGLPVFVVKYSDKFGWWQVTALNELGRELLPPGENCKCRNLDRWGYIQFMYKLRGIEPPGYVRRKFGS